MIRRRTFLKTTLFGAACLVDLNARWVAAEPPPETTRIRLVKIPSICRAPQYIADEFLRGEGFTDVQYVEKEGGGASVNALASGEADITMNYSGPSIIRIDAGDPLVFLAGIHVGCFEVFGTEKIRSIRDLKGKTVAVVELGGSEHVFLTSMAAYVGLDPRKDIHFITRPRAEAMRLLAEGQIDGYLGFPPDPQELRAKKIGHVVVNSTTDRPWSQYFCCMATGNKEFVRKHPVATKRVVRAILKANEVCSLEPARVARFIVDKGYAEQYDHVLQTLKDIPYSRWRDYHPEDTIRFYALRLHEVGMIKASPQKIIARGTDWRFLNELKKELKG
ncbi:MAG TPA: ABC transporter substrate-binding protein [Methylomirabilota bacterium]|jgi:NitT/TauT family transport system substrate-binding protein|nr:ABC transporter substrate-binding protein [Methylomirabilota bacterium]